MDKKTTTLKVRVTDAVRDQLYRASEAAGADDFSEWARRILTREATKVLAKTEAAI